MLPFSVCLLTALGLIAASPLIGATPSLKVDLTTPAFVSDVSSLWVVAAVTNTGNLSVSINPHGTVLSSIDSDDFEVDGSEALGDAVVPSFVGAFAKHVTDINALKATNVLIGLAPGESKSVNSSLANRYDFASSGAGTYTISASPLFHVLSADGTRLMAINASAVPARFRILGTLTQPRSASLQKRIAYPGCSSTQQSDIQAAVDHAQTGSQKALAALKSSGNDSTYSTWFGASSASRLSAVESHYDKMNGLFSTISYDCSTCDMAGTYAYTYPTDPTRIYLCEVFWTAPQCGTDSKQGTLVHESSHFNSVASTRDYAYGKSACEALASSSPEKAIENADSHEYYEETLYSC